MDLLSYYISLGSGAVWGRGGFISLANSNILLTAIQNIRPLSLELSVKAKFQQGSDFRKTGTVLLLFGKVLFFCNYAHLNVA